MKIQIYLSNFLVSPLYYVLEGSTPYLLQNNQKISSLDKKKNVFTLFDDNQHLISLTVNKAPTFINPHGTITLTQKTESAILNPDNNPVISKENANYANNLTHQPPSEELQLDSVPVSFGRTYTSIEALILSISAVLWLLAGAVGALIGYILIQKLITIFLSNKNKKEKFLSCLKFYALAIASFFMSAIIISFILTYFAPTGLHNYSIRILDFPNNRDGI